MDFALNYLRPDHRGTLAYNGRDRLCDMCNSPIAKGDLYVTELVSVLGGPLRYSLHRDCDAQWRANGGPMADGTTARQV